MLYELLLGSVCYNNISTYCGFINIWYKYYYLAKKPIIDILNSWIRSYNKLGYLFKKLYLVNFLGCLRLSYGICCENGSWRQNLIK